MSILRASIAIFAGLSAASATATFSQDDLAKVQSYWNSIAKYETKPSARQNRFGKWQVRLTAEGSTWIWKYNKIKSSQKVNPKVDLGAQTPAQKPWEVWFKAQVAWDQYQAAIECQKRNLDEIGKALPALPIAPPEPGDCPAELVLQLGQPPKFASAVVPTRHEVSFEDVKVSFEDNVAVRPTYAYYRFPNGVADEGTPVASLSADLLDKLFDRSKINGSVARVMTAISPLEGGFDSINTYDTGFVSVGFIQFASLREGKGSLGELLSRYKSTDPFSFDSDFRRFGVDVTTDGYLSAVNLVTLQSATGSDANTQIIEDKRLISVFARAGKVSDAYRSAQLSVAKKRFYPGDDNVKFNADGTTVTVRVSDIIRSEAGIATLMDRNVNTGNIRSLSDVLSRIYRDKKLTDPMDLADSEIEIITAMRWRENFLKDKSLSQPATTR